MEAAQSRAVAVLAKQYVGGFREPDPDKALTKAQASEAINDLQNGSYDPDKWTVPF